MNHSTNDISLNESSLTMSSTILTNPSDSLNISSSNSQNIVKVTKNQKKKTGYKL